jgi:hypothetical protein
LVNFKILLASHSNEQYFLKGIEDGNCTVGGKFVHIY